MNYYLSGWSCRYLKRLYQKNAAAQNKRKRISCSRGKGKANNGYPCWSFVCSAVSSCGRELPLDETQVDFLGIKVNQI